MINKFLKPPLWLIILLAVLSAAALISVFVYGIDDHPVAYVTYVLSFYTLSVICYGCFTYFPSRYRALKEKIYQNKLGKRLMTDAVFKTHLSLYLSFGVNLLYAGVNLVSFILYGSAWFVIFTGYYMVLAFMRLLMMKSIGKPRISALKRARLCGYILLTVNLSLSGAILMILYQNRGFEYKGMLIYIMAMYTFYITVHAVTEIIKYRRHESPVLTTAKTVNLSAALFSMLSLETAMLSQFGADMSYETRYLFIALTGAGVSLILITMSVLTILYTTKELKKWKTKNSATPTPQRSRQR